MSHTYFPSFRLKGDAGCESCLEYIQCLNKIKKESVSFSSLKIMICKEKKIDLKATETNWGVNFDFNSNN